MIVYKDYDSLVESPLFDRYVISLGNNSVVIFLLLLLGGPFMSILPMVSLMVRPYITDQYIKRIFNWFVIIWLWTSGSWIWVTILTLIEMARETLRFGVPRALKKMSNNITFDPVTETLFRRLCRLLRSANRQNTSLVLAELYAGIMSYSQRDISGAFDENEKQRFRKFFTDFPQTCFILDEDRQSVTVFFPSFVIRLSPQGIQITSDEAMKLIRSPEEEDFCAICRDQLGEISVRLNCSHQYCLNCIFTWLNRQYTCPVCRGEVS